MNYSFEVKDLDAGGRIGTMKLGNKVLETPNLFPVVNPFQNLIPPQKLFEHYKVQALFTNAYIIYQNRKKNQKILEEGLHKHLGFPGIIATDSGGFQDYMYSGDIKLEPEEIEPFQEKLGSDCPVILDIPVQVTDTYEEAKKKIEITIKRAKENINRRKRKNTAWFGPIHGSIYPKLLKLSAIEMSKLDFGIYAIGGIVKTFIDYRFDLDIKILLEVKKWIRPDRPLHMFGLGLPAFFSLAVACGADTFDSAAYILYAKDDRYFTLTGTKKINDLIELPCHCPVCTKYSAKEIRKLSKRQRTKALAEHNLYHSFSELHTIKQAIKEGTLWDLVEQRVGGHPKLIKALQKTKEFPEYFDQMVNMKQTKGQQYLRRISFYRAHIKRFRYKAKGFSIPQKKSCLILLPELDLPSFSGKSFEKWFRAIYNNTNFGNKQIAVISNLMGIIPYELGEIYPAGQHEGFGDIYENTSQKKILLNDFEKFISNNLKKLNKIKILIPKTFISEYNEEILFSNVNHIINYVKPMIEEKFKNIKIITYSNIEDLVNENK